MYIRSCGGGIEILLLDKSELSSIRDLVNKDREGESFWGLVKEFQKPNEVPGCRHCLIEG